MGAFRCIVLCCVDYLECEVLCEGFRVIGGYERMIGSHNDRVWE